MASAMRTTLRGQRLTRIRQHYQATARVARWTGLWLRAQLKKDPIAKFWLSTLGGSLDEVVTVETD
jgi:hypothetical protein